MGNTFQFEGNKLLTFTLRQLTHWCKGNAR